MRFLERRFKVRTRFGGGFVQSIDGLSGGSAGGRPVDWFFYVNGIEAASGAASHAAARGRPRLVGPPRLERRRARPRGRGLVPRAVPQRQRRTQRSRCGWSARRPRARPARAAAPAAQGGRASPAPAASSAAPAGREILRVLVGPWPALRIRPGRAADRARARARAGSTPGSTPPGRELDVLDGRGRVGAAARRGRRAGRRHPLPRSAAHLGGDRDRRRRGPGGGARAAPRRRSPTASRSPWRPERARCPRPRSAPDDLPPARQPAARRARPRPPPPGARRWAPWRCSSTTRSCSPPCWSPRSRAGSRRASGRRWRAPPRFARAAGHPDRADQPARRPQRADRPHPRRRRPAAPGGRTT